MGLFLLAAAPVPAGPSPPDTASTALSASAAPPVETAPEPTPAPPFPRGVAGAPIPSDEELSARGALIGEIVIRNENIFDLDDPREDNRLFRLANRLHATTRPWVIRSQLLFRTGEPYDRRLLQESERILRANEFFFDARIRPIAYHDGRVDVEVFTRDVWTLRPGLSFRREGGANTISFDVEELNLLGTGVGVGVSRGSTPERDTASAFLRAEHAAGTWVRTELFFAENSDGRARRALIERPFYALDVRRAAGARIADELRVDTLVGRPGVADSFQTHETVITASAGLSEGLKGRWVRRYTIGFTRHESRFAPAPGEIPLEPVPPDRILAYPWLGFELLEDAFEEARNRDQIVRTEDFFLGTHVQLSLGYANAGFGADREAAIFSGRFRTGFRPADASALLIDTAAAGRHEDGSVRDTIVGAVGRVYVPVSRNWLAFCLLSAARGIDLDPDRALVLGGENGLRGYPREYQAGDRRALVTLEGRYYTKLYPFRLFHIGAAVFYDMGRAWGGGFTTARDPGVLRNVGAGLRIGNARSALGRVIHVDVAFPLDGDPSIAPVQVLVETKLGF